MTDENAISQIDIINVNWLYVTQHELRVPSYDFVL